MAKKNIRQVIRGEYVMTPIKNAFNNKTSYWMSKQGCVAAMYLFTVEGQGETVEEFEERLSEKGFKREIPRFEEFCKRLFNFDVYQNELEKIG